MSSETNAARICPDAPDSGASIKRQRLMDGSSSVRCSPVQQLWSTAGLKPGDEVFVKWFIEENEDEDDEDEEEGNDSLNVISEAGSLLNEESQVEPATCKRRVAWWKGIISATPSKRRLTIASDADQMSSSNSTSPSDLSHESYERDDVGRFIWTIHYESMESFQAEQCRVVFLDHRSVLHLDYQKQLPLQFSASPPTEEEKEQEDDDGVITLQEIIDAQKLIDDEEGDSSCPNLESLMQTTFNSLPHTMKVELALKYRFFTDNCEAFLRQLIQEKGCNHVVSVNEVKQFVRELAERSCRLE